MAVYDTTSVETSAPDCFKNFIAATTGPECAEDHIQELNVTAQTFVCGRFQKNKFRSSSVDRISNVITAGLKAAGMKGMTPRSIRGATLSKIVTLHPEVLQGALDLGRWTNQLTFDNHYQGPVNLATEAPLPPEHKNENLQQILRWGFTPTPPIGIAVEEHSKGPGHWKGQHIQSFGAIESFVKGDYGVRLQTAPTEITCFFHYQLMAAIAESRC
jgi:hypothetical protein